MKLVYYFTKKKIWLLTNCNEHIYFNYIETALFYIIISNKQERNKIILTTEMDIIFPFS